jgi:hypothetical protein
LPPVSLALFSNDLSDSLGQCGNATIDVRLDHRAAEFALALITFGFTYTALGLSALGSLRGVGFGSVAR